MDNVEAANAAGDDYSVREAQFADGMDDKQANAKSMLFVMGLGAKNGDVIVVKADGADEADAAADLETFFKENL